MQHEIIAWRKAAFAMHDKMLPTLLEMRVLKVKAFTSQSAKYSANEKYLQASSG